MSPAATRPPSGLDGMRSCAQRDVEDDMRRLDRADGHVRPRAYLGGAGAFELVQIEPAAFSSAAATAAVLGVLLPGLIRRRGVALFGLSCTLMLAAHKPVSELDDTERATLEAGESPHGWPPASQWRRREEQVLALLSRDREELWRARVVRVHAQTPQLGYWGRDPAASWAAMFDPIRAAIRDQSARAAAGR